MVRKIALVLLLLFCSISAAGMVVLPLHDPYAIHADGNDPLTANWDAGLYKITTETLDVNGTATIGTLTTGALGAGVITGTSFITGGDIGISGDTDLLQLTSSFLTVNGSVIGTNLFADTLYLEDPQATDYDILITATGPVTQDRGLLFTIPDAGTVVTLTGSPTLGGQDYQTTGSPIFASPDFTGTLTVDTINEHTAAAGVTIDSVVLKDGGATLSADLTVNSNLKLKPGTVTYQFGYRGNHLTFQNLDAGFSGLEFYARDGDGSDDVTFQFWGKGTPGSVSNRERMQLGWDTSETEYFIMSEANGSGTLRPIDIYTEGNQYQLFLKADGKVGFGTNTPTSAVQMGNDKLLTLDTNAGITASTTQSQGQGALTAQINEISTVANKDDTITLPTAVMGIEIEIINNGANTLLIFPASGDNLGLGVNTAEELQANERVKFVAYDTTNWAKESTTEIIHAEIHDEDNTDAFVINVKTDFHSYHTNGLTSGDLADWTFDAGGAGTSHAITGIADAGGGDITVTTGDAHNLAVGDIISQTNLADANYVGVFDVLTVPIGTTYTVTAAFTATGTGTVDQAATLEADAVAAGVYSFAYCISATPVGNNETFDFQLYKEATAITGSKIRRKFGAGGDFGSMSGCGVISVGNGEKISLALSNEDTAANLTIRNLTIVLIRL